MNRTASRPTTQQTRSLALATAAIALAALLLAPAVRAAPPVTFAESGQGAGKLDFPNGVAVDQSSGDVYVAENNNKRVSKFDAAGNFLLAWGYGVADGASHVLQTCGPQASPPTRRCFAGPYFANGPGGVEQPLSPQSVAVEQSSGDVFVADGGRRVFKFTPGGELLLWFGKNVNRTPGTPTPNLCTAADLEAPGAVCGVGDAGSGPGEYFYQSRTVVVDSEENLWVGDTGRLIQFDSGGHYVSEAAVSGAETRSFARDSAGDFYAIKPGKNEDQEVTFSGSAAGDTFRLGNLPAGCSSSNTDPIEYQSAPGGQESITEALESKCGSGNLEAFLWPPAFTVLGRGKFSAQDIGQLTCEKVTGAGSCSVSTRHDGLPAEVVKFEASGSPVNTLTSLGTVHTGAPRTLTVDAADNLYVGEEAGPYVFKVFSPAGEQISQFGAGQVVGTPGGSNDDASANAIAIGESAESLYSVSTPGAGQIFDRPEPGPLPGNERAEDVLPTTATLAATLNPEGNPTTYFFEYGTDQSYGTTTPVEALAGSGFDDEAVQVQLDHLIPDTTYHFRLVATNHCNASEPAEECTVEGEDTTFTTPPAVQIESQWATDVTARTATLHAELDPLGVEAEAWLEYGTDESYGETVALANLGSGFGTVARQAAVAGLQPGTTYHYRFVARDERDGIVYVVHGPDRTIVTQVAGLGFKLADSRAWELVSPPDKHGALIKSPWADQGGHLQAAAHGNGLLYNSVGSIEADPEGSRVFEDSSVMARRGSGGAWSSKDLTLPHTTVTPLALGSGREYKIFSPDLNRALVEQRDPTLLSPQASERTPYLRHNTEPPAYTPLVSGQEGFANVPPGTVFGGDPAASGGPVRVVGASPQLDHVLLESNVSLAVGAPAFALYLWADGELALLSVRPAGEGGEAVSGQPGSGSGSIRNAISEDGSRVFWSSGGANPNALYVRDTVAEHSARLDVVQLGATGGAARPVFQGASADGTVVFFTDSRQLTEDASLSGTDLYRCEIPPGPAPAGCDTLTDISAPLPGSGEAAEVQGIASAISQDGARIYFVAKGVLDTAPNGQGDVAVSGQPNLYLWQQGEGTRFIATLAGEDSADWGGPASPHASRLSAAGSPSGRYLAFMSQRSLSGYDNRDAASNEPLQEVFRYDALADELICASCNPSGARPVGLQAGGDELTLDFDPQELWSGRAVAAVLPEATKLSLGGPSLYRTRAVHDNGRVFFNAADSLVSADSNGRGDVYQYEPTGVGDCSASSGDADTSRSAGGCVSLISSGTGDRTSAFLDASEGGDDVFFYTTAQLSVLDEDGDTDVYDARVAAKREPTAECLGEACQAAAQAPNDATPASAAFRGQGNVRASPRKRCAKGKRKVRRNGKTRCVARKHRKGHGRNKRAGQSRRATR